MLNYDYIMDAMYGAYGSYLRQLCWHFGSLAMRTGRSFVDLASFLLLILRPATSVPQGFPESGNGLWYTHPGGAWSKEWLPIGNGYLAGA